MSSARRKRGLSLIEVLVALAILSLAMLALIPMFALGVRVNASSNQLSIANALAREKLEELIEYPTTSLKLSIPSGQLIANPTNNPTYCANDLPLWYNTQSGATSTSTTKPTTTPAKGWYQYPCVRTYTVEAFTLASLALATPATVSSLMTNESSLDALPPPPPAVPPVPYYAIKRVTVTVQPSGGPFPGLRKTTQTAWVKYRNALPN